MTDTELQGRVNQALDYINVAKNNWSQVEEEINMTLDDDWDFDTYEQAAALDAAMAQLNTIEFILKGGGQPTDPEKDWGQVPEEWVS